MKFENSPRSKSAASAASPDCAIFVSFFPLLQAKISRQISDSELEAGAHGVCEFANKSAVSSATTDHVNFDSLIKSDASTASPQAQDLIFWLP